MNTTTPTIIFSVCNAHGDAFGNAHRHAKSVLNQRGIPYFEGTGCYKGEREDCFILQDIVDNLATVQQLAKWYQQESILLIDANRQARLETPQGELIKSLGTFREVRAPAAKYDAWTRHDGRYWVAA